MFTSKASGVDLRCSAGSAVGALYDRTPGDFTRGVVRHGSLQGHGQSRSEAPFSGSSTPEIVPLAEDFRAVRIRRFSTACPPPAYNAQQAEHGILPRRDRLLPSDIEYMTSEERVKFFRYSPGMLAAEEVARMIRGTSIPLTEKDLAEITPILSQAAQAATPIPGFVWKHAFTRIARYLQPGWVKIAAILAGAALPILIWLNAQSLYALLIRLGLFDLLDFLRTRL